VDAGPEDPISSLTEGAVHAHELFMAYVNAGFTRPEALQLIAAIISASVRPPG
jgi:hypothetical protein